MNKRVLYVSGIVVALLVLAIFGESILPLLLIAAVLLIIAVSSVLNRLFAPRMEVSLSLGDLSGPGEPVSGEIAVENPCRCPFPVLRVVVEIKNLFTGEKAEDTVALVVPGRGRAVSSFHAVSAHCGKAAVTVKSLKVYDSFGTAALFVPKELSQYALILPELFPIDVTVAKSGVTEPECDRFSPYKAGNDPSETFAVRDYEPGDALRSIHWKLTGKYDRLMIREASLPVNESVLILFERVCPPGQPWTSPSARHALGEILLSLSHRLTEMNAAHTVGWLRSENGTFVGHRIDSEESFQLILPEILSVSEIRGEEDTVEGYLKTGDHGSYSNIVYIASSPSETFSVLPQTVRKTMILCSERESGTDFAGGEVYAVTPENYRNALYQVLI
ncbi:MAG: DUF58 domain-containing protein [Clostridia bacterium]